MARVALTLGGLMLSLLAAPLAGQVPPDPRAVLRLGLGATFGGVGVQGELFPFDAPFSVVAAAGYGPLEGSNSMGGATFAVATRVHFGRQPRPGFLELSYSPIASDQVVDPATGLGTSATLYGLGVQLGGQLPLWSGLHVMGGIGAGYALTPNVVASRWKFINQLGLGYSFGRRRASER